MTDIETEVAKFNAKMEAAKIRTAQHQAEHNRGKHQGRPKPGCFQCFRARIAEEERP